MNFIQLTFPIENIDQADLITAMLDHESLQGIEQTDTELNAFFKDDEWDEPFWLQQLSNFKFTKSIVPQQNWNQSWESNFEPIRISDEIGIRADFHPAFDDCKYDIVITPKMSFGTGHHETTQMMLQYTNEIDCQHKSVFDFGCGTGVLAILSTLKGASKVIGIDNDDWAVENAIENCARNNCSDIDISIRDIDEFSATFDIILANINLNVLKEYMPKLASMLNSEGHLVLSGILVSDFDEIKSYIEVQHLKIISIKNIKNWQSIHVIKK